MERLLNVTGRRTGIISDDGDDPKKQRPDGAHQIDTAVAVLHGAIRHTYRQEIATIVDQDVALAAVDLLRRVVAAWPGGGITLIDWL